ncbi:MAG: glycosyltransferase, partial [bacterium]
MFFPGGSGMERKGIYPFLKALFKLCWTNSKIYTIIPIPKENDKIYSLDRQKIEKAILDYNLEKNIIRLPFTNKVEEYFAASDIVVVPFVVPHFSRAAIEAGAMAKPVVGSKIGGI